MTNLDMIRNKAISNDFSHFLRQHASNKLMVQVSSMAGYIQTVLVPEAAVMLIMEDMNVDQAKAIEVLEESHDFGNLLNPADDDDVF